MTFEEMKKLAERIVEDLNKLGYSAELLEDSLRPGQALPIAVVIDGEDFCLEFNVL